MLDQRAIEVVLKDADNIVVGYKNVFVQVRTGRLTASALERIDAAARRALAQTAGPIAALIVPEESAEVTDGDMRHRQMRVVRDLLRSGRTYGAVVVGDQSVRGTLMRIFGQILAAGQPNLTVCSSAHDGVRWLSSRIATPNAEELGALVAWSRAQAAPVLGRANSLFPR